LFPKMINFPGHNVLSSSTNYFMYRSLGILIFTVIYSTAFSQKDYSNIYFYVSSFDEDHLSGIALYNLNFKTGEIVYLKEFGEEINSDYLAIGNNGGYLVSVAQEEGIKSGLMTSFSIDKESGLLEYIDEFYTDGHGPCHVAIDNKGNFAFVAHYDEGVISVILRNEKGELLKITDKIKHTGSSVNKDRQESAHPHMVYPTPRGSFVLVPDLGMDKVMAYHLKSNGRLKPTKQKSLDLEPGSGPRHIAFHPNGNFGYVVNELNSTVTAFTFNKSNGSMTIIESKRSVPDDYSESNYLADVHLSRDGRFLYASNRGHNSLSVFKVDESIGGIELIDNVDCGGDWPRAFNISPTGDFLLVANEKSDNIVVFRLDEATGMLTKLGENSDFPAPRCIKFLISYR